MTTTTLIPEIGRSTLPFIDPHHPDRPIEVNFYRPVDHGPDDPVVIVQHGMLRNGDEYRDFWVPAAEKHRILIVAPTFSDAHFPEAGIVQQRIGHRRRRKRAPSREVALLPFRPASLAALRNGGVTRRPKVTALRSFRRRTIRASDARNPGSWILRGRHRGQSGLVHPADAGARLP